ncbi:hypothetical protein [Flavobacterium sp. J27]|uniref:hypothetical protein n=1 Tax=Flavobacterium sp. J27 TaxID=2060419 RepID=UPI00103038E4|nr:hypothetical protein [Flavobacterium sp. J27]
MKKYVYLFVFIYSVFTSLQAQSGMGISEKENGLDYWTEFNPKKKEYREAKKILTGYITENTTLYSRDTYLLQGVVYVTNNAVLTIEPGTVIRGDYNTCGTLVITKGAKIMAEGTESFPIVFTTNKDTYSRKPGDWGGIIVMGDAPVNTFGGIGVLNFDLDPKYNRYGGDNVESSSGALKFVRIEYSGRKLSAKKELNGISFAGVGNKTKIENIQISYSNDDSFEFYGGNVRLEKLVSYRASDDDFDFTQGVQATITNSLALRHPYSSDAEKSRCMEIDSYDMIEKFDSQRNKTNVKATNVTFVNTEDNDQGLVKEAVYVGSESYFTMTNSVVYGFKDYLLVKDYTVIDDFEEFIKLKSMVIAHCDNAFGSMRGDGTIGMDKNFFITKNSITISDGAIQDFFKKPNFDETPDFRYLKIERNGNPVVNVNK